MALRLGNSSPLLDSCLKNQKSYPYILEVRIFFSIVCGEEQGFIYT